MSSVKWGDSAYLTVGPKEEAAPAAAPEDEEAPPAKKPKLSLFGSLPEASPRQPAPSLFGDLPDESPAVASLATNATGSESEANTNPVHPGQIKQMVGLEARIEAKMEAVKAATSRPALRRPSGITLVSAAAADKGMKLAMEDYTIEMPDARPVFTQLPKAAVSFYAVIDGHGGSAAALYVQTHLASFIAEALPVDMAAGDHAAIRKALIDGFKATDKAFLQLAVDSLDNSGACVVAALVLGDFVYIANAGDCKAILARLPEGAAAAGTKLEVQPLSQEHTPIMIAEKERVRKAGGQVDKGRINGKLAVTRSIGDKEFKAYGVSPVPQVLRFELGPHDQFIVLGCDGIFSYVTTDAVVELAAVEMLAAEERLKVLAEVPKELRTPAQRAASQVSTAEAACKRIVREAIFGKKSKDNATVVMISFHSPPK